MPGEHRRLSPRSWPLAAKLLAAMLTVALVPGAIIGFALLVNARDDVSADERGNLELLATVAAARVDELITATRGGARFLGRDPSVRNLAAAPLGERAGLRVPAQAVIDDYVAANPTLANVLLLDRTGRSLISTDPRLLGRSYAFRPYFTEAIAGRTFTSNLEVAIPIDIRVVVVAAPILAPDGRPAGVAVVALRGTALDAHVRESVPPDGGLALLVDEQGIVVSSSDPRLLLRSLGPLPPAERRQIRASERFAGEVPRSLDRASLAATLGSAGASGSVDWASPVPGQGELAAGYARLATERWTALVSESRDAFVAPLDRLAASTALVVALVGLLAALAAVLLARSVTRPVRALSRASSALERGEYDPDMLEPATRSGDDLGRFARVFARMAEQVTTRERSLRDQVARLRVEVDEQRAGDEAAQITDSDHFREIEQRARELRRRRADAERGES